MKGLKIFCLIALLTCASAFPVSADTFEMDPTYSIIVHKIKHLMGYSIGSFEKFSGTIELDEKNEKIVRIDVAIDVASVNTRNQMRDDDLRSDRFFDVENHPQATFQSTKITKNKIIGNLTIKGITKKVTLDYTWSQGIGKDQYGNTKMALSANGEIDRTQFKVDHNQKLEGRNWLLGEDVELSIEIQGKLAG